MPFKMLYSLLCDRFVSLILGRDQTLRGWFTIYKVQNQFGYVHKSHKMAQCGAHHQYKLTCEVIDCVFGVSEMLAGPFAVLLAWHQSDIEHKSNW